jgi:serine/threonine protein kinase
MGSLSDLLHNESMVIEGGMILPILRDIAQGLRFLHEATPQIVHCDLKAQNVLGTSMMYCVQSGSGVHTIKLIDQIASPVFTFLLFIL